MRGRLTTWDAVKLKGGGSSDITQVTTFDSFYN